MTLRRKTKLCLYKHLFVIVSLLYEQQQDKDSYFIKPVAELVRMLSIIEIKMT